jgi:hypothetical protein
LKCFHLKFQLQAEEIKHLDEINQLGEMYNPYRITKIVPHIKELLPDAEAVILTDGDVHGGLAISNSGTYGDISSSNSSIDILILGHNEYVTQQEYYDNLNFVANDGVLICLDGNVFYCVQQRSTNSNFS